MSPEEEEAVQAELEALQREAMVSHIDLSLDRELMDSQMSLSPQRRSVWLCRMCQSKSLRSQKLLYLRGRREATSPGSGWPWRLEESSCEILVVRSGRMSTKFGFIELYNMDSLMA